jgi:predicted component of type VI protein secretion system
MKLSLVVLTPGKQEGKALPIGLPQFLIGRDPQCQLRPASASISKRHCALIQRDGKVFVRDFDSTNGTFVNDEPVKGEVELHHDDRLRVGPLLFGVVLEEAGAPVNRPTPPPPTKAPAAKAPAAAAPAAKAPAAKPPAPAKAPAPAGTGSDDESVAAMLLELQDDSSSGLGNLGSGEIPEGSTVMDMVVPPEGTEAKAAADKKPTAAASTSNAAKAILEKYMKRPR